MSHWWRREKLWEPPFRVYVGKRGSCKSLLMASDFLDRPKGQVWYSNMEMQDPRDGYRAGRIYSWEHLSELEGCIVALDEINLWANSNEWDAIPSETYERWCASRKNGIGLIMTAHSTARIAKTLRELIDEVCVLERHPLRISIDSRLPFARVQLFDSVDEAEKVKAGSSYAGKEVVSPWATRMIRSDAYEAYATGESQTMQIKRREGAKRSELPIRHPCYVDVPDLDDALSASAS